MTVQMNLNMKELNDIYYALGKVLMDNNVTYRHEQMEKLKNTVWEKIEQLDVMIKDQIEQDEIKRDLNFKHAFARKGDY